jgi:hypothetical protein
VRRCEAHRCRVGPGRWTERDVHDGAPMLGKANDVSRLQTLLVVQRLYPRVQLHSTEILGRTKAVWWLKVTGHRGQRRWSSAKCGRRLSVSRGSTWGHGAEAVSLEALQLWSGPLAHGAARRRQAQLTTQRTVGR